MVRVSGEELQYQLAIRGWDQQSLARESGVSATAISRAMSGTAIRGANAMRVAQALRRVPPIPELEILLPCPSR